VLSLACPASVRFEWDFGDGSTIATAQNSTHSYALPGTYTWRMTASIAEGLSCIHNGTVTVRAAPTITDVWFDGGKNVVISGQRFGNNARILINGVDRTDFLRSASDSEIKLKGKAKKLGIKSGANTVQIIDASGTTSNIATLTAP